MGVIYSITGQRCLAQIPGTDCNCMEGAGTIYLQKLIYVLMQ